MNLNEVEGINEEISEENVDKFVFNRKQADIRKVWKTSTNVLVDTIDGTIYGQNINLDIDKLQEK